MDKMRDGGDKKQIRRWRGRQGGGNDGMGADCCTFLMCRETDRKNEQFFPLFFLHVAL